MLVGVQTTPTDVMAGGTAIVTTAEPDWVESSVDVAVIVPFPAVDAVNTPDELIVPADADQVTAELYAPVPVTVAEQEDVCPVRMEPGEQVTETEVIAFGTVIITVAEPDLVESSVDVAVTVPFPAVDAVKTPDEVIVPPVADQETVVLYAAVPVTVAEH